jgi:hypothetical protein
LIFQRFQIQRRPRSRATSATILEGQVKKEMIMRNNQITTINTTSFIISLASIVCGVVVALLGIWQIIPAADGTLWRALGTCGAIFAGSVGASLAIRCFKTNE